MKKYLSYLAIWYPFFSMKLKWNYFFWTLDVANSITGLEIRPRNPLEIIFHLAHHWNFSLNYLFHKVTYLHHRRFLFSFDFFAFISALVEVAFYTYFQQGAINLQNASIEKTEEGRGRSCIFLQSHAAPPLWKCASKSVISARDRSIPGTERCL